ncbi:MAG: ATP-grasp domain-containing protein [Paludibacteraceae bacterium]|nr:ATP-grasp domain-containing protein [Paludibacteraceae bacterium]
MSKLMVIGASILQLPAILKAKQMGHTVAVVDYNPQAVGIPFADTYYNASTMDEDAVLNAAMEFQPDGIMTLATDMPMRGVAKTSDRMHLHSISYDTAVRATDKYEMIQAFKRHGVPSPWYYKIDSLTDLQNICNQIEYPCIMKPTDNAGSHGVVLVHTPQELISQYEYSHQCARHGRVIVEQYLDGPEVSVEIMVVNHQIHILQITDKLTTGAPYFVELGHSQPSQLPFDQQEQIKHIAQMACEAIGIQTGPAHVEIKVTTQHGPMMIELGARMGGDNITTHLVPLSTGIDMVEGTIRLALGESPNITPALQQASAIRYFQASEGTLSDITGVEKAKAIPGVKEITFTKSIGEKVSPIRCSNDRIGSVIAQAKTPQEAIRICEQAIQTISIHLK